MTATPDTVHVVDDDASWRTSAARLMSAAGYAVEAYASAERFLEAAVVAPGCVLLDLRMPGLSGLQLQQRLAQLRRALPIVFVSGHGDIPASVLAIKGGAEDFLTKPVAREALLDAVGRAVARGHAERAQRERCDALRSRLAALTPSERKVFELVVRGKLNKQIGAELDTTERTVKWHRHNLMQKLKLRSVAELVALSERLGQADALDDRAGPDGG